MAKAELVDEENVSLDITLTQAALIKQIIGSFASNSSGPLNEIWEELEDLGVGYIDGIRLIAQSEPVLYLAMEKQE